MESTKAKAKQALPTKNLPPIPTKRYFTIGEASVICGVKPYVLRYWEEEFSQIHPVKRRGNRRYYQEKDLLLIRRIRQLLYDEGYTINGARKLLAKSTKKSQETKVDPAKQASIAQLEEVLEILEEA